jgi:uncharacterized HAD superfamily protein
MIIENKLFEENKNKKVYNIDIDGTLTNGEKYWEQEPTVNKAMKEYVIDLYAKGNVLIMWTARQWSSASITVAWLIKNEIPFHGIHMNRGGADFYIDDKAINATELLMRKRNEDK